MAPERDTAELLALFSPQSIAVIGASPDPERFGGRAIANLIDYKFAGRIFAVNPKYDEIAGSPCYPNLRSVPSRPDAAILTVGAASILPTLEECGELGVKLAIVFGAGFAESGQAGALAQAQIADLARRTGLRILGPNCLGFLNATDRVVAVPATIRQGDFPSANISLVSQSGMLAFVAIHDRARDHNIGFRYVITTGNECDVDSIEVIRALLQDPGTRVVTAYLEGIKDATRFRSVAREAVHVGKPIVLFKVGRSAEGAMAARTHTASLAGSDAVHDAVFRSEGVIRVADIDDIWQLAAMLASQALPSGPNVAIVGTSGGLNGVFSDDLRAAGLRVPSLTSATQTALGQFVPSYGSTINPVDITGFLRGENREDDYGEVIQLVDKDPAIDITVFAPGIDRASFAPHARILVDKMRSCSKPALILSLGGTTSDAGLQPVDGSGVPVFRSSPTCARLLSQFAWYAEFMRSRSVIESEPIATLTTHRLPDGPIDHESAVAILGRYGIPLVETKTVYSPHEAVVAATGIGFPVALKIASDSILHRTEVGGVALGLHNADAVRESADRLLAKFGAEIQGLQVQPMVADGLEVIVGIDHDPQFGPVVVVGIGGVFVELLRDTALALPPLDELKALDLITHLKGAALLDGFRGSQRLDRVALANVVAAVSRLAIDHADSLWSLDLNPVVVRQSGVVVLDWLVAGKVLEEEVRV